MKQDIRNNKYMGMNTAKNVMMKIHANAMFLLFKVLEYILI